MFAANLKQLAIALGGDVTGRRVLCPGPGHTANDRSLQIVIKPDRSGGFSVRSYAGDDWRICRDHVLAAIDGQPLELSEFKRPGLAAAICGNGLGLMPKTRCNTFREPSADQSKSRQSSATSIRASLS